MTYTTLISAETLGSLLASERPLTAEGKPDRKSVV